MNISVCPFAVNFMSIQSTEPRSVLPFTTAAVKGVIDFIYSPELAKDFHTLIKSLGALAIIPRHPRICGTVCYFNAMLIINFSCYCATVTVTIMVVLLANFGGEKTVYRISLWQQLLGRPRMWWEDDVQLKHKETMYEGVNLH